MEKDRDQCRLRLDYRPADGSQGQNLFDIPIIDYLLMCKDFEGENMKTQEYLDRQSTYHIVFLIRDTGNLAKTEHSHPLGMVVSTHFRCGKGVKRGLKNGALPFNID